MNALDALMAMSQPGYESGVREIAQELRARYGAGRFDNLPVAHLADALTRALEETPTAFCEGQAAHLLYQLSTLEWWCGLSMSHDTRERLAQLLRRDYRTKVEAANMKRPKPDVAARRNHVVFCGILEGRHHSPTVGAVGYFRALASDPKTRRIEVYHQGPLKPELLDYLSEQLPANARIGFVQIEQHPEYLALAAQRAPATYHFWCHPRPNIDYSVMAMFGPTLMFTCADDPPIQYADVYWYPHEAAHIERAWATAPAGFRANYVATKGADFHLPQAKRLRSKEDLGVGKDMLLLATVGNRLSIDLDEAFVTGVERRMRERPELCWMMVGRLPEALTGAMRQVLGPRFLHLEYDTDLRGLMGAVDIWLNPFRRGGGNSAIIASAQGAPVLTRGDMGDVAAWVPAEHWASGEEDYFERLDQLIADPALRAAWGATQEAFVAARLDKPTYAAELDRLVALAFERFKARAKDSLPVVFPADVRATAAA